MRDYEKSFSLFVADLDARMAKGAGEYQEKSWSRDPIELLQEIREEIVDIAGWGVVLYERVGRLEDLLRVIQAKTKG